MIPMRVVLVAALLLAAPRVAPAAPPQCKSPANLVVATICASPALTARDAEIAQRYDKLHAACSAGQGKGVQRHDQLIGATIFSAASAIRHEFTGPSAVQQQ